MTQEVRRADMPMSRVYLKDMLNFYFAIYLLNLLPLLLVYFRIIRIIIGNLLMTLMTLT